MGLKLAMKPKPERNKKNAPLLMLVVTAKARCAKPIVKHPSTINHRVYRLPQNIAQSEPASDPAPTHAAR